MNTSRVEELCWISDVSQTQSVSTQAHFPASKLSTAAAAYLGESWWLTHWCLHPLVSAMPCTIRVKEAGVQLLTHHCCCFHALGCHASHPQPCAVILTVEGLFFLCEASILSSTLTPMCLILTPHPSLLSCFPASRSFTVLLFGVNWVMTRVYFCCIIRF